MSGENPQNLVNSRIRAGNERDVVQDGFVRLSPPTHDISFMEDHVPDIYHVAADIDAAVQAVWAKRHKIRYSKAYVLLLSWEDDDLGVQAEINELRYAFEERYHFEAQEYKIPRMKPDRNVKRRIIKFLELESKDTLLLVYYAGHARRGQQSNEASIWFANREDSSIELPSGGIQSLLEESDSDVLLLYDCCHSATIPTCGSKPGKGGVTEVIAACGFEATAPEVDEHSFTKALTHTLVVLSNERPFSVASLHAQVLSRLKCWSPGVQRRPEGGYVSERQPRRTPIYSILSETRPRRSIVLGPLPLEAPLPQNIGLKSHNSSRSDFIPSIPSMSRDESPTKKRKEFCEDVKYAQILLAIRVDKSNLNNDEWVEWIRNVPEDGVDIHVEGRWDSFSTLVLLRMPIAVWNLLPEHPAYSFVGFVTSENLAVNQTPTSESTSEQTSDILGKEMPRTPESNSSAGSLDLDGINTPLSEAFITSNPQLTPDPISFGSSEHQDDGKIFHPTGFHILDRNLKKILDSIERLGRRWNHTKAVTLREKVFFISGVLNILISGYLIGGYPQYFHYYYTAQLLYLMPIRYFTYYDRGWDFFLADLCYIVNFLCMCTIWVFPYSTRLFIGTYCLAFGNNAFGIAMWRNLMVFHSLEKTTTLFIHIMPCVALHCLVHLLPPDVQQDRFPAIWAIKNLTSVSKTQDSLLTIILWSTVPYAIWQISYYFIITVYHREEIAAGRPTSFTWIRKSYSKAAGIGKYMRSLPEPYQEPTFMILQYCYVVLTTVPCLFWFWYRYASGGFLILVFCWSVYNGATYYIEMFDKHNQNELRATEKRGQKWQDGRDSMVSLLMTARLERGAQLGDEPRFMPLKTC